jgi:hypothetical protein
MNRRRTSRVVGAVVGLSLCAAGRASAQSTSRAWSRISFFTNSAITEAADGTSTRLTELSTAFTYRQADDDDSRAEYGADIRFAGYAPDTRPQRASIYEAYVGGRFDDGQIRVRAGHLWLTDLGSLGSVAGAQVEVAQPRDGPDGGRYRIGTFAGAEPAILDAGYAPNVRKFGAYVSYDGAAARRDTVGYVLVRNASLVERSVVTTTNFVPIHQKVFIYQAAEFDVQPPAGQADRGLTYFFATGRVNATERVELQGTYNKGRSIDVRSLSEDILAGRPLSQQAVSGFLYESIGGRATVEVAPRVRVYAGYSRDKNNQDSAPAGRTLVGAYAGNVAGTAFDLTASESLIDRPDGSYQSQYVSIGRMFGRKLYVSADYTTSLSIIQFSRSDGVIVQTQPHTTRVSGTANWYISRTVSLLTMVERSKIDGLYDLRILSGLTYRIR